MGLRVTLPDLCLLYLVDRADLQEDDRAAQEMTQDWIAQSLRARRSHVSRAMTRMVTRGLVKTAKVHVAGEPRRRLAYFLTDDGLRRGQELRRHVEDQRLSIIDLQGLEAERRLYEVPLLLPRRPRLSDLVSSIRGGRLDLRQFLDRQSRLKGGKVYDVREASAPAHFRGRAAELDRLASFYDDPKPRGFVLVGLPGIGKTALAAQWVATLKGRCHVLWRRLSPDTTDRDLVRDLAGLLASAGHPALADYLQRPPEGGKDLAITLLREGMALASPLLVIDDAQRGHREASSLLGELLRGDTPLGSTKILLLSRERLPYVRAEDLARGRIWELELADLSRGEALAVLQALGAPLEKRDVVVERCGGHPLSLELAGAGSLPLEGARRTSAAWVAEEALFQVDAGERRALGLASILEVAVPLQALGSESRELLRRCLLRAVEVDKAVVHDLIREAVVQSLSTKDLAALHLQAGKILASGGTAEEIVGAIRHLLHGGGFEAARALAVERGDEIIQAGFSSTFLPLLDTGAWVATKKPLPPRLRLLRGEALFALGRRTEASKAFEECRGIRDPMAAAVARLGQGKAEFQRGSRTALPLLLDARNRLERLGALRLFAEAQYWIGGIHEQAGRINEAREAFERGRAVALDVGDRRWEGLCAYGIGRLRSKQRDFAGAVEQESEALALLERGGHRLDVAKVCTAIGGNLVELDRLAEAEVYLARATAEARTTGAIGVLASALYNLASMLYEKGDVAAMIPFHEEALASFELIEEHDRAAESAAWLAWGFWKRGQNDLAERHLRRAEDLIRRTREPALRVKALRHLGRACWRAGHRERSREYLTRALSEAQKAQIPSSEEEVKRDLRELS